MTTPEPFQGQPEDRTERRLNPLKRKGLDASVPLFPEDRFFASLLVFGSGCLLGVMIVSLGLFLFGADNCMFFLLRLWMEPVGYGIIGSLFWGVVAVLAYNADLKYVPAMFIGALAFHYFRLLRDFSDMGMGGMNFTHPDTMLVVSFYLGVQWLMWRRVIRLMRRPHSS